MSDLTFNTTAGAAVGREMLILYMNTGSGNTATWSPIGRRVEDSSMSYDWGDETKRDILGTVRTTMKTPIITQTFDPCELDAGDAAQVMLWNQAICRHDVAAMTNVDLLVVHVYAGGAMVGTSATGAFAERYPSSAIKPSGLGGSSNVGMPIDVTFGGERVTGTATKDATTGAITFTASA